MEELKAKILQIGIDERGRAADNIPVVLLWGGVKYEVFISRDAL